MQSGVLHLTVDGRIAPGSVAVEATVLDGSEKVATASGTLGAEFIAAGSPDRRRNRLMWVTTDLALAVKDAKPWTPDTPFLYDLVVEPQRPGRQGSGHGAQLLRHAQRGRGQGRERG